MQKSAQFTGIAGKVLGHIGHGLDVVNHYTGGKVLRAARWGAKTVGAPGTAESLTNTLNLTDRAQAQRQLANVLQVAGAKAPENGVVRFTRTPGAPGYLDMAVGSNPNIHRIGWEEAPAEARRFFIHNPEGDHVMKVDPVDLDALRPAAQLRDRAGTIANTGLVGAGLTANHLSQKQSSAPDLQGEVRQAYDAGFMHQITARSRT